MQTAWLNTWRASSTFRRFVHGIQKTVTTVATDPRPAGRALTDGHPCACAASRAVLQHPMMRAAADGDVLACLAWLPERAVPLWAAAIEHARCAGLGAAERCVALNIGNIAASDTTVEHSIQRADSKSALAMHAHTLERFSEAWPLVPAPKSLEIDGGDHFDAVLAFLSKWASSGAPGTVRALRGRARIDAGHMSAVLQQHDLSKGIATLTWPLEVVIAACNGGSSTVLPALRSLQCTVSSWQPMAALSAVLGSQLTAVLDRQHCSPLLHATGSPGTLHCVAAS